MQALVRISSAACRQEGCLRLVAVRNLTCSTMSTRSCLFNITMAPHPVLDPAAAKSSFNRAVTSWRAGRPVNLLHCVGVSSLPAHYTRSRVTASAQVASSEPPTASVSPVPSINSFVLSPEEFKSAAAAAGLAHSPLIYLARHFLPHAASQLAIPPISNFHVAAAAIGSATGRVFIGVNLELPGLPLCHAVHAEQFALALAESHGEPGISAMVITHPPCGHCRQFMQELRRASHLKLVIASTLDRAKAEGGNAVPQIADQGAVMKSDLIRVRLEDGEEGHEGEWSGTGEDEQWLGHMIPHPFGPHDLLPQEFSLLLEPRNHSLSLIPTLDPQHMAEEDEQLLAAALSAANRSYAPYSNAPSGVSFLLRDGSTVAGPYLESAAYNPSLPALQTALVSLVATQSLQARERTRSETGGTKEADVLRTMANQIVKAAVVELEDAPIRCAPTVAMALREFAPHVQLLVRQAKASDAVVH